MRCRFPTLILSYPFLSYLILSYLAPHCSTQGLADENVALVAQVAALKRQLDGRQGDLDLCVHVSVSWEVGALVFVALFLLDRALRPLWTRTHDTAYPPDRYLTRMD